MAGATRLPMLGFIGLLASAPAAFAQGTGLDALLDGFENCAPGQDFGDFSRSLAMRFASRCCTPGQVVGDASVAIVLPPKLAAAIGEPKPTNAGDYTDVVVPLTGTYRGQPLKEIRFVFGNENGIGGAQLVFALPRKAVVAAFGAAVAEAARRGEAATQDGPGFTAAINDGEPGSIVCDWST